MELLDAYHTKEPSPPEGDEARHTARSPVASESRTAEQAPELLTGYLRRIGGSSAGSSRTRRSWTSDGGCETGTRGPARS